MMTDQIITKRYIFEAKTLDFTWENGKTCYDFIVKISFDLILAVLLAKLINTYEGLCDELFIRKHPNPFRNRLRNRLSNVEDILSL